MKVLLYTEALPFLKNSGLGKAIQHQKAALAASGIPYTTNPRDDYDIIHLNFYGPKSIFLASLAKEKGKKVVFHAHSTEEDFRNSFVGSNLAAPWFKKWITQSYALGDVIITPTKYSKRLLENYGLSNIVAVSNGVDTDYFRHNKKSAYKFRSRLGLNHGEKIVLGMGLFIERKGISDFVNLAKTFSEKAVTDNRYANYRFVWLGYSPIIASTAPVWLAFTEAVKLDNIIFTGQVDKAVVKAAMSAADVFLFPTHEETEGIPILEAFACKTPALVREIPVFDEYGEDVVRKADTHGGFERKILSMTSEKGVAESNIITERARGEALARDKEVVGRKLAEVYLGL